MIQPLLPEAETTDETFIICFTVRLKAS